MPTRPRSSTSCSGRSPRRCSCTGWPWCSPPPGRPRSTGSPTTWPAPSSSARGCCSPAWRCCWSGWPSRCRPRPSTSGPPTCTRARRGGSPGSSPPRAKVAGFAALARVLTAALGARADDWVPAVAVLAAVSVVVGTLLAIAQDDVKRLLAYSSVAHAGFILTALVAGRAGVGGHVVLPGHLRGAGARRLHRGGGGVGRRRRDGRPAGALGRPGFAGRRCWRPP